MINRPSVSESLYAVLLLLVAACCVHPALAQSRVKAAEKGKEQPPSQIEIMNADVLTSQKIKNQEVRKLKGNVRFKQDNVIMDCDSAYFYGDKNAVDAWGNIHINQGDSVNMYGKTVSYDGNSKHAVIKKDVRLMDRQMTLTTDQLDYDMSQRIAFYTTGGVITDAENRLESQRGYYYAASRDMFFRKDVKLTNPQYLMECDTLQYNILTRKAFFHGPTTITSNKDKIYCETGWYHTQKNLAEFGKNAYLSSQNQFLYGDSMYYDRNKGFGRAIDNIRVVDTTEHLLIEGQFAEHYETTKRTFITDRLLVTKGFQTDSLYLTADTLYSYFDSTGTKRILKGYHHVRIYDKQFQGKCDSLIYSFVDSTMDMYKDPVLWFDKDQITAERIKAFTKNNNIVRAELYQKSFMVSPEDSFHYNQVKGRNMTALFLKNELYHIDVNGNSESIYYVRDEKKGYIGMNHVVSSDIGIQIRERAIKRINFKKDPKATMTPMKDLKREDMTLAGFSWRISEKPVSVDDLRAHAARAVKRPSLLPQPEPSKKGKKKKEKKAGTRAAGK